MYYSNSKSIFMKGFPKRNIILINKTSKTFFNQYKTNQKTILN